MTTVVLEPTPAHVARAARALARGEPVAFPTETVYGLAAPVFDERAIARVFSVKERPTFDPLIVHVSESTIEASSVLARLEEQDLVEGSSLAPGAREAAERLLRSFWPGPFTLVLPKRPAVPDLVTAGLPTVALRMPRHPVAQALIAAAGAPLAAPSANRFGRLSPTTAAAVVAELGGRIEIVLDGGACAVGVESTVVALDPEGRPRVLRPGGTPLEAIERIAGAKVHAADAAGDARAGPKSSPGMLASHYAPSKPLLLLPGPAARMDAAAASEARAALPGGTERVGLLVVFGEPEAGRLALASALGCQVIARTLSPSGDLEEAARRLFAALRELDASEAEVLFAEPCPIRTGLGHAIADRLERAARRLPRGAGGPGAL